MTRQDGVQGSNREIHRWRINDSDGPHLSFGARVQEHLLPRFASSLRYAVQGRPRPSGGARLPGLDSLGGSLSRPGPVGLVLARFPPAVAQVGFPGRGGGSPSRKSGGDRLPILHIQHYELRCQRPEDRRFSPAVENAHRILRLMVKISFSFLPWRTRSGTCIRKSSQTSGGRCFSLPGRGRWGSRRSA